jgi:hypothetical protein
MRKLLILAAVAAVSAACHNRSQDEVGAAPDRGDTTAVATDSTTAARTDSTMGQVPCDTAAVRQDAGVTADSTGVTVTDSTTVAVPADSTSAAPTDTTAAPKQ